MTIRAEPVRNVTGGSLRRGGILYGVFQYLGMALGFLGSMIMVRISTQQELGDYFRLLQAISAIGLILQLGLGPAALRFAPISRGQGGDTATAVLRRRLFQIQMVLWTVVIPPLALAWPWIARQLNAPDLAKAAPFVFAAAILLSFGHLVDNYLRAFRMYATSALLAHFAPRALLLSGFVLLWLSGNDRLPWEVLVSVYVGAQIIASFGYAVALARTTPEETSEPRPATMPPDTRTILGATTAMGLRSATSVLFVSSDMWILGWARSAEEVAVYGVASRVLQVMAAIPGVVNFIIPQEFSVLFASGRKEQMERLARVASTAVALISALALLGILLVGRPLIGLAFGPEYVASWGFLLVLSVGAFWDTASGAAGFALQMSGHHNRLLLLTAVAAFVNIGLSLALAPSWGGYGVAFATTATLIGLNIGMVRSARSLIGVRTFVYLNSARWKEVVLTATGRRKIWEDT